MVNIEQMEAWQLEVNEKIKNHIAKLPEEERKKFEAVTEATRILTAAKVPFYLFPMLISYTTGISECSQYNNASELLVTEVDGKLSKESLKKLSEFNSCFTLAVMELFMRSFLKKEKLFDPENWSILFKELWAICLSTAKDISERMLPEYKKKIK